jgi:phosphatidylglycerophosphatase A
VTSLLQSFKKFSEVLAYLVATGFGVGLIPKAPGTFGSVIGLACAFGAWQGLERFDYPERAFLAGGLLFFSALVAQKTIEVAESRLKQHDAKSIVIDEVIGQMLTVIWFAPSLATYAAGFLLFRLFDILKPGPIGHLDRNMRGAWGTLMDDLLAGSVAAAMLFLLKGTGIL